MIVYTLAQLCTLYAMACDKDKVNIAYISLGIYSTRPHFAGLSFFKELR